MNDEHQFESDIETLMTGELGWTKGTDKSYVKWRKYALDLERLIDFVKATQQNAWEAFVHSCGGLDVYATFYRKFEDAVGQKGLVRVLRDGFHANGKLFKVLAPKPENGLNDTMSTAYEKNICQFIRQWHYSEKEPAKSVDIVLQVNGIPLATLEAYKQNDEAFKKLLEDKEKYEAVKRVLAQFTFQENLRRQRSLQDDAVDTPAHLWASGQVGVEMPIPEGYVAVLPVQAKWYKQIKDGVKRIEYREVSSRMTTMLIAKKPVAVRLMYGYAKTSMTWQVDKVVATNGTYAIHLGRRLV